MPKRLLIADDHALMLEGLARLEIASRTHSAGLSLAIEQPEPVGPRR